MFESCKLLWLFSPTFLNFNEVSLIGSFKKVHLLILCVIKKATKCGRGCGAVGRAVTSDTRDPWFESRHQQ